MSTVTTFIGTMAVFLTAYYLFARYHGRVAMYVYDNHTLDNEVDEK